MADEQQVGRAAGERPALGVDATGLARAAVALLGGEPGGALAGLGGLEAAFVRAGLGDAFSSWVATGPNRAITAADLERALGTEAVGRLARSMGSDPARVAAGLALVLPQVVDQLTPSGALPAGDGDPARLADRLLRRS
jgi:uncharacterized protein YidB (DUF937 family)